MLPTSVVAFLKELFKIIKNNTIYILIMAIFATLN